MAKRVAWILDLVGVALIFLAAWGGSLRARGVIEGSTYHLLLGLTILELLAALALSAWCLAPRREPAREAKREPLAR